jgi:hypothetical protein
MRMAFYMQRPLDRPGRLPVLTLLCGPLRLTGSVCDRRCTRQAANLPGGSARHWHNDPSPTNHRAANKACDSEASNRELPTRR